MDTSQLHAFITIAEAGSFSAAATRLHLTQPAVSKRIALLEQGLGARLFDRIGKGIALTPAGSTLLPHARQILQQVSDATQAVTDLAGVASGRLSVATSHHIGLHRLPRILKAFSRQYPEVALDLHFLDSERAQEEILAGHFDIAVVTLGSDTDERITSLPIWHDTLEFVAAKNHALTQASSVTLTELTAYQAILPDANTHTTRLIRRLFDQAGLEIATTMVTNHLDTIRMMASIGLGWAVLPNTLRDQELAPIKLRHPPLMRTLGAIYHRHRSRSIAAESFLALLNTEADKY